jgi:chemotaxis protein CheD
VTPKLKIIARAMDTQVSGGRTMRGGGAKEKSCVAADSGMRTKVYLHPGQLFVSMQLSAVTTILGSCVSLCLWDPVTKIGGVNHYLLPFWVGDDMASPRFGTVAIETLIEKVISLGAHKTRLRAKLFGGACVIEAFRERDNHIGVVNARLAEDLLRVHGIPVVEQDVAGRRGRKLIFYTDNGTSWVKYL